MTSGRIWGARLAALMVAIIIPACQSTNPAAVGVSSSLWISISGVGGTTAGTTTYWIDPNLGTSYLFTPDPYDIRTYTRPDIFILGNNHPLMTDISAKQFPNIVFNEDRARDLINQQRYTVFVAILGLPLPFTLTAKLVDHTGIRQNCRAHSKHYAVWHPTLAFPAGGAANVEGDTWTGRLTKCGLTVASGAELTLAGLAYRSGDDVANKWISLYCQGPPSPGAPVPAGQILLDTTATHMSVGFWQLGGTGLVYYWTLIICKDPNSAVTLPTIPFGGPGF